jgi:hypothetical protein
VGCGLNRGIADLHVHTRSIAAALPWRTVDAGWSRMSLMVRQGCTVPMMRLQTWVKPA